MHVNREDVTSKIVESVYKQRRKGLRGGNGKLVMSDEEKGEERKGQRC